MTSQARTEDRETVLAPCGALPTTAPAVDDDSSCRCGQALDCTRGSHCPRCGVDLFPR